MPRTIHSPRARTAVAAFARLILLAPLLFAGCGKAAPPRPPAPAARTIAFPFGISLGTLHVRPWDSTGADAWEFFAPAQGSIAIPAARALKLRMSVPTIASEAEVERMIAALADLPPGALQALEIRANTLKDSEFQTFAAIESLEELAIHARFDSSALRFLAGRPRLRALTLANSNLEGRHLALLEGLPSLERLVIDDVNIGPGDLTPLRRLPALRALKFRATNRAPGELPVIMRDLGRLRRLRDLELFTLNAAAFHVEPLGKLRDLRSLRITFGRTGGRGAPPSDFNHKEADFLAGMKNLEVLEIGQDFVITDRTLEIIGGLERLRVFEVYAGQFRATDLAPLAQLPRLEEFALIISSAMRETGFRAAGPWPSLRRLNLESNYLTDADLPAIGRLTGLRSLDLSFNLITGEGFDALSGLTQLTELNLTYLLRSLGPNLATTLDDDALRALARLPSIEVLELGETRAREDGIERITQMPNLRLLTIYEADLTTPGILALAELSTRADVFVRPEPFTDAWIAWPEVALRYASQITDAGWARLPDTPGIRNIILDNAALTDAGLAHLARLPALEELVIQNTAVSSSGLAPLAALPRLRSLRITGPRFRWDGPGGLEDLRLVEGLTFDKMTLTEDVLSALKRMPSLEMLSLSEVELPPGGLRAFNGHPRLRILSLDDMPLDDVASLAELTSLPALIELALDSTGITDAGLAALLRVAPLERLFLREPALTDVGLAAIARVTSLEYLRINGAAVTDQGVASLATLKGLRGLQLYNLPLSPQTASTLRRALPGARIEISPEPGSPTAKSRRPIGP